jgi:hypothetical protein
MSDTRVKPLESIRRKLRSLEAVLKDPAATAPERETAAMLKARLEGKLLADGGDWTGVAFRLGRKLHAIDRATAPPPASQGSAKLGFRLGRVLGAGLKKWRSI